MRYSIVETPMKRDGLERWEAEEIKDELRNQALAYLAEGDIMSAMDIMYRGDENQTTSTIWGFISRSTA